MTAHPVGNSAVSDNPVQWRNTDDRQTPGEREYYTRRRFLLTEAPKEVIADQWPLYCSRQWATWFMARYELFQMALNVKGSIVECGVGWGGGLMLWAQLSSILEPYAHNREIIGFDTFAGFPHLEDVDGNAHSAYTFTYNLPHLQEAVRLYDYNRACGHLQKVRLVQGDACSTIPQYLEDNQHTLVALLSVDFDIYAPTKVALEALLPRMPSGAVLVFDEINNRLWPGETQAMLEALNIHGLALQKFPWCPQIAYAVLP